jgi:hypothetical protein
LKQIISSREVTFQGAKPETVDPEQHSFQTWSQLNRSNGSALPPCGGLMVGSQTRWRHGRQRLASTLRSCHRSRGRLWRDRWRNRSNGSLA